MTTIGSEPTAESRVGLPYLPGGFDDLARLSDDELSVLDGYLAGLAIGAREYDARFSELSRALHVVRSEQVAGAADTEKDPSPPKAEVVVYGPSKLPIGIKGLGVIGAMGLTLSVLAYKALEDVDQKKLGTGMIGAGLGMVALFGLSTAYDKYVAPKIRSFRSSDDAPVVANGHKARRNTLAVMAVLGTVSAGAGVSMDGHEAYQYLFTGLVAKGYHALGPDDENEALDDRVQDGCIGDGHNVVCKLDPMTGELRRIFNVATVAEKSGHFTCTDRVDVQITEDLARSDRTNSLYGAIANLSPSGPDVAHQMLALGVFDQFANYTLNVDNFVGTATCSLVEPVLVVPQTP